MKTVFVLAPVRCNIDSSGHILTMDLPSHQTTQLMRDAVGMYQHEDDAVDMLIRHIPSQPYWYQRLQEKAQWILDKVLP